MYGVVVAFGPVTLAVRGQNPLHTPLSYPKSLIDNDLKPWDNVGMVDYNETLAYAGYWRNEIIPHLQHLTDGTLGFSEYMREIYRVSPVPRSFGLPLPYIFTLEFIKRYKPNCVSFMYNTPDEVQKGASMISAIYQFPAKSMALGDGAAARVQKKPLHALVNIHFWRDEGDNDSHVTCFFIYEKLDDILLFTDANQDIVKQPKDQRKGFAAFTRAPVAE